MGPGFESLMVHHIFLSRGIAQLVEQRSPKPRAEGSNPSAPAIAVVICIYSSDSFAWIGGVFL